MPNLQNNNQVQLEQDETEETGDAIHIAEPQRTSTPEMISGDVQNLNETILAGHLVQPLNDVME